MPDAGEGEKATRRRDNARHAWRTWLVNKIERYTNQHHTNKKEDPSQRATIWASWATVAIAAFTCVLTWVGWHQLGEMRDSGIQMDRLILQNRIQTAQMTKQANKLSEMAGFMEKQADRTNALAESANRSANAAEVANTQSKALFQLQNRAWMQAKVELTGPLHFRKDGAFLPIKIALSNTGHSPASHVTQWAQLLPGFAWPTESEITSRCQVLKKQPIATVSNGVLVFPDDPPIIEKYPVAVIKDAVDKAIKNSPIPNKIGFYLLVCVDYGIGTDSRPQHHQTRQIYGLSWSDESGVAMGVFDPTIEYKPAFLIGQGSNSAD